MKRYWYVLIEHYDTKKVKAAIIKEKLSMEMPINTYRREPGRKIIGKWCESLTLARAIVAYEIGSSINS